MTTAKFQRTMCCMAMECKFQAHYMISDPVAPYPWQGFVKAVWDPEAKVFYSESDIEAGTVDEFEEIIFDTAIDLIVANHMSLPDLADTPLRDLIPAVLWQRPEVPAAA